MRLHVLLISASVALLQSDAVKGKEKQAISGVTPAASSYDSAAAKPESGISKRGPPSTATTVPPGGENATAGAGAVTETAKSLAIAGGQPNVSTGACQTSLTFEIVLPSPSDPLINFTDRYTVSSAKQCADLCYIQHCVQAGFVPPFEAEPGTCLLASEGKVHCDRWGAERVSDYTGGNITQIQCVRCEPEPSSSSPNTSTTIGIAELGGSTAEPSLPSEAPSPPLTGTTIGIAAPRGSTAELGPLTKGPPGVYEVVATFSVATSGAISTGAPTTEPRTSVEASPASLKKATAIGGAAPGGSKAGTPAGRPVPSTVGPSAPATAATSGAAASSATTTTATSTRDCTEVITFEVHQVALEQQDLSGSVDVENASECARACYERNCTVAGYAPAGSELNETKALCFPFGKVQFDECGSGGRVSTLEVTSPILIGCLKCESAATAAELIGPKPIKGTSSVASTGTKAVATTPSATIATAQVAAAYSTLPLAGTEFPAAPLGAGTTRAFSGNTESCDGSLTFEVQYDIDFSTSVNYTYVQVTHSVKQCAELCFTLECSIAGYTPPIPGVSPLCLLSFAGYSDCGKRPPIRDGNDSAVTEIRCVRCGNAIVPYAATKALKKAAGITGGVPTLPGGKETAAPTVAGLNAVTAGPTGATNAPSASGRAEVPIECNGSLTFEAVLPDPSIHKLVNFTEQLPAASASECAKLCYSRRCLVAGYSPSLRPGPPCNLAYSGGSGCGRTPRIRELEDNRVTLVEIHCIQCMHYV